jgi:hypothetical protein
MAKQNTAGQADLALGNEVVPQEDPQQPDEQQGEVTKTRKKKVMTKDLAKFMGKLAITVLGTETGEMIFDPKDLPQEIQARLPAFALNHRLGDAAAGKVGQEAVEAINKVWEGMMANNWSVRAPAAKKINVSTILDNLDKLDAAEQEGVKAALAAIGISL